MSKKSLAVLLVTGGVLVFLFGLSADSLGIGQSPGLGVRQIALALIGVIAAAAGMVMLRSPNR